jgi:sulfate permease, SulP family
VGAVPSGLPSLELPDLGLVDTLLPAAAGIALMAYVESIAAARAFGRPDEPEVDADRELVAIGAANVASGAVAGLPAGGGLSQTAVNDAAGARTPFAGSVTAGVTLLVLLFLTGLFDSLPQATLGAVVIVAAAGLVDVKTLRAFGRIRGSALVLGLVTLVGVLLLGVLGGVLIGVLASMLGLVHQLNRPDVVALARAPGTTSWHERGSAPGEAPPTGVLVVRIGGPVYFANAGRFQRRLLELVDAETEPTQTLVIDLVAVGDIDVTTMQRLPALERALRERGVTLRLARPNQRLAEHCERMPELADLRTRIHGNVDDAVRRSPG